MGAVATTPIFKPNNQHIANSLRSKKEIVITKADKGSQTVVMNTLDYISKMNEILNNSIVFKPITTNEKSQSSAQYTKDLRNLYRGNTITAEDLKLFLGNIKNTAYIYGQPKTHKPGIPIRPIIAYHMSPIAPLAKFLANFLIPILKDNPTTTSITSLHTKIYRKYT
ncbi:hypothetical protein LAZ67_14002260 [Cordylochernes scorpioides]|uniref:Reverse transcriptase domain-containing protein n=1 Tax=Cordylochernes scorpioides TaxID=51811 RepID=A0ABY6L8S8_9ARAC|nr:hypothetical protein LAZ67_14002260 [Cordylochernes scorpioides]